MKAISIALFLSSLLSLNSFSQKLTYKDLTGCTWYGANYNVDSIAFTFIDSVQFMYSRPHGVSVHMDYKLDNSSNLTIVYFGGAAMRWLIKMTDENTLKIQRDMNGEKPIAWSWDENETTDNTGIAKRGKLINFY